VGPRNVVVHEILAKQATQVAFVEHDDEIKAFAAIEPMTRSAKGFSKAVKSVDTTKGRLTERPFSDTPALSRHRTNPAAGPCAPAPRYRSFSARSRRSRWKPIAR
jgi:hypothetical protein